MRTLPPFWAQADSVQIMIRTGQIRLIWALCHAAYGVLNLVVGMTVLLAPSRALDDAARLL